MFISLKTPLITREVFNIRICLFLSSEKGILAPASKEKIEDLINKNRTILIISSFPELNAFRNEEKITFLEQINFQASEIQGSFDAFIICCEYIEETLKKFISEVLQENKYVFVASRNDEDLLKIFKQNSKDFLFFSWGYDDVWRIKRFNKDIPRYLFLKM